MGKYLKHRERKPLSEEEKFKRKAPPKGADIYKDLSPEERSRIFHEDIAKQERKLEEEKQKKLEEIKKAEKPKPEKGFVGYSQDYYRTRGLQNR